MDKKGSMLYIGAWADFKITNYYLDVKKFIYVDGQPRTEFSPFGEIEKYEPEMYRHKFIERILKSSEKNGFTLTSTEVIDPSYIDRIMTFEDIGKERYPHINPEKWIFENEKTKQTIHYYISTSLPINISEKLKNDIKTCDKLYVSGYDPHSFFVEYMKKPFTFIGSSTTCFGAYDEDRKETICYQLNHECSHIESMINKYELIDQGNKLRMKVKNFHDLSERAYEVFEEWLENGGQDSEEEF